MFHNLTFVSQNQTLAWASFGNSYEKIGFLKAFFNCLGETELKVIKQLAHRTKSKKVTKERPWTGPTIQDVKDGNYEPGIKFGAPPTFLIEKPEPQGSVKTPVALNSLEATVITPGLGEGSSQTKKGE